MPVDSVLALCDDLRTPVSFVRPSQSETVVYLEKGLTASITKFYTNLHTRRVYNLTGYYVTGYFQFVVIKF